MHNLGGGWPGAVSLAGLGQPGRYSLCFAENSARNPWEPFHVELGFDPGASTVTLMRTETVVNVTGELEEIANAMGSAASQFSLMHGGRVAVLLSPYEAQRLADDGWSKRDVRRFLMEHARRTVADLKRAGRRPGEIEPGDETTWKQAFERLEDILIVCAGGQAGCWSACLPGWGNKWTRSVTTPIDTP